MTHHPLVLGIHAGHNAGAAIVSGGRLLAAVSEERIVRVKNVTGYPRRSIELCLALAGAHARDLDRVALASRQTFALEVEDYVRWTRAAGPLPFPTRPGRRVLAPWGRAGRLAWRLARGWANRGRPAGEQVPSFVGPWEYTAYPPAADRVRQVASHLGVAADRIAVLDHHECHAAYSRFAAPWRDEPVLVLVADQVGDYANSTVWRADPGGPPVELARSYVLNSLGRIYSAVTGYLGMKPLEDEHKVMGLAPYARFEEVARLLGAFDDLVALDGLDFVERTPPEPCWVTLPGRLAGARFDSVAGAVQTFLEGRLARWVRAAVERTGIGLVALGGGLALNVKANRVLGGLSAVRRLHVPPGPGDESLAIGAAWAASIAAGVAAEAIPPLGVPALGEAFDRDEARRALGPLRADPAFAVSEPPDPAGEVARRLAAGEVVAFFSGRMEFGPRALGGRSILADASDPRVVHRINAQVKMRDFWMPFAPAILAERTADYFDNPKGLDARAMTIAFRGTPRARIDLAAAIHPADGTLRPQVVHAAERPEYHAVIARFAGATGRGGILNTSFNLHGEPIVRTPEDAVRTFLASDLDALAIEGLLVERVRAR